MPVSPACPRRSCRRSSRSSTAPGWASWRSARATGGSGSADRRRGRRGRRGRRAPRAPAIRRPRGRLVPPPSRPLPRHRATRTARSPRRRPSAPSAPSRRSAAGSARATGSPWWTCWASRRTSWRRSTGSSWRSSPAPATRWSTARRWRWSREPVITDGRRRATARGRGCLTMINRVLIANRGEIALRILRACRTMGIEAVVAYSEADRTSLPALLADEAICIGPGGRQALLPLGPRDHLRGHGHRLRRHPPGLRVPLRGRRVRRCRPGARPHLHRAVGAASSSASRPRRRPAGCWPRTACPRSRAPGCSRTSSRRSRRRSAIGYPVLIKPSAGGGGKGMRMVRSPRELAAVLPICRSEAKAAFGDDALYLEKWLEDNRHVEIQVAVDRFGYGVHLWERDCSVQRRHQKILEESPVPGDDPDRAPGARRARDQGGGRRGLREHGHARVPRGRRGQRLLHRDQLPDPGGAPGHGDADRHRPRGHSRSGSPPASPWASPRRTSRSAATPSSSGSTPRTRCTTSGPAPGPSSATTRRAGPGSASTPTPTPATRSRRTTTRSWASSSVWGPTREAAIARGRAALDELVIEGVVTNTAIHRALLASEPFLEGRFTTNLLDRIGSAAFLAGEERAS